MVDAVKINLWGGYFMEENQFKCVCGWSTNNPDFFFCLACGRDLNRGAVQVECCGRLVADPWVEKMGFVRFCPFCGKQTRQVLPSVKAARQAERDRRWQEEREREERTAHPPLLEGLKVRVETVDSRNLATTLLADIKENLGQSNNFLVVITETADEARSLFSELKSPLQDLIHGEVLSQFDTPSQRRVELILWKYPLVKVLFTTATILSSLDLPHANRFFVCIKDATEVFLKVLNRLASPLNMSREPILIDYLMAGEFSVEERKKEYETAGATILDTK
ncbi:conserved hypothetical protein [delta proteobacterium NaphS2]|nr:conserved hypothetical protein [delta proteobacterium NaphS2]